MIEASFPNCRTIVEILDGESMKFLNFKPLEEEVPRALWPQYASGRVYLANTLDTLIAQAFYNPTIVDVLRRLITDGSDIAMSHPPPTQANGNGYPRNNRNRRAFSRFTVRASEEYTENGCVVQMKVPPPFFYKEYSDLYMELVLTLNIMPIALYRSSKVHRSPLPYVLANPRGDTVLHPDDRLFVLCHKSVFHVGL